MISSWRIHRFKSVYDDTPLTFAPLTLFSGINNSGKSTVIQSILLTSQTLSDSVHKRAVSLNGNLVRLGTFNDIVSNGHESEPIKIGFTLTQINPGELRVAAGANRTGFMFRMGRENDVVAIESEFTFSAQGPAETERKEILQLQPTLQSTRLRLAYRGEDGEPIDAGEFEFRRRSEDPKTLVEKLKLTSFDMGDLTELSLEVMKKPKDPAPAYQPYLSTGTMIGAYLDHFVPRAILTSYDHLEEDSKQIVNSFLSRPEYSYREKPSGERFAKLPQKFRDIVLSECKQAADSFASEVKFITVRVKASLDEFSASFGPEKFWAFASTLGAQFRRSLLQSLAEKATELERIARGELPPEIRTRYQGLPERFELASDYMTAYFQSCVKYLAPLRDEPKPVYPLAASSDPRDIGLRGEHTAAVLELNREETVIYVPSESFSSEPGRSESISATLADAVRDWMRYMGVVTNVKTQDLGNRGHELKVSTGTQSNFRDLTHVGVGVSQVLPIVVLCLLSPPGTILIFEQPELHLHPRVQSRLADFFLSMTFLGKQCIVETHSEHLINRLRLRTAGAPGDQISSRVMIYFVGAEDGRSKYTPVPISRYGTIQHWPKGFFDEGEELAAAIIKAGVTKRRAEGQPK